MRPGAPRPTANPGLSGAMAGAVDLAAVKARSEAAERAAAAPPPLRGEYVSEVAEANFQAQVLDRSFQVPILLSLWAERSEPSKQLTTILEKLATEDVGSWLLAKIDVEANQQIAQMLQVQSVPTVFAVIGGQLVPGFQGSLPEPQLREFLAALLDAAKQAGLSSVATGETGPMRDAADAALPPEEPGDPRFVAAEEALEAGDFDLAAEKYQAILSVEPANSDAQFALRQVALLRRLSSLPADAVQRAARSPDDVAAQLAAADAELAANQIEQAFARLVALVRRLRGDDRATVRDRLVEYFELIGPDDPRVAPARRDLANALF